LLTSGTAAQFELLGSTKRSRCFVPTCDQDWAVSCYFGPGRRGTCSSRSAGASRHSIG